MIIKLMKPNTPVEAVVPIAAPAPTFSVGMGFIAVSLAAADADVFPEAVLGFGATVKRLKIRICM